MTVILVPFPDRPFRTNPYVESQRQTDIDKVSANVMLGGTNWPVAYREVYPSWGDRPTTGIYALDRSYPHLGAYALWSDDRTVVLSWRILGTEMVGAGPVMVLRAQHSAYPHRYLENNVDAFRLRQDGAYLQFMYDAFLREAFRRFGTEQLEHFDRTDDKRKKVLADVAVPCMTGSKEFSLDLGFLSTILG